MKPIKPQSQMTDKERVFWSKYANFILSRNVSGHAAEWAIRYAQQFAYNLGDVKMRDVDKAYLSRYFDKLGRCDNIVSWRFQQAVSAVEMGTFEPGGFANSRRAAGVKSRRAGTLRAHGLCMSIGGNVIRWWAQVERKMRLEDGSQVISYQ